MKPLVLKQSSISPESPTTRVRVSDALEVGYGVAGFEIRQAPDPASSEAVELVYSTVGFQIGTAIAPRSSEALSVVFAMSEFIFKTHPTGSTSNALTVGFTTNDFTFKRHPDGDTSDALNMSFGTTEFLFAGSSGGPTWDPLLMRATPRIVCDDKSALTLSAAKVTQWNDRSGFDLHFTQPTTADQPSVVLNALAARSIIRFGATDRLVSLAASTALKAVTSGWMFVAIKKDALDGAATTRAVFIMEAAQAASSRLGIWNGLSSITPANTVVAQTQRLDVDTVGYTTSTSAVTTDWVLIMAVVDYENRTARLFLNGELQTTSTGLHLDAGATSDTISHNVSIGAVSDGSAQWTGDMACALMGRGVPTLSEIDKLFGYYAGRYGLQSVLTSGHPYKTLYPYPTAVSTKFEFEAANGTTVFTDVSATPKTWTRVGSAVIATSQFYNGSSSFYNAPGVAGAITTSYHEHFDLSKEDFCIRACVRPTGSSASSLYGTVISKRNNGSDFDWVLYRNQSTGDIVFSYGDASYQRRNLVSSFDAAPVDTWTHVAVSRYRDTLRLWINGALADTHTIVGDIRNRTLAVDIGRSMTYGDSYWGGWIDDLEVLRGDALYFENFSPPPRTKTHIQNTEDAFTVSPIFVSASTRNATLSDTQPAEDGFEITPIFVSASSAEVLTIHTQPIEDGFKITPIFVSAGTSIP